MRYCIRESPKREQFLAITRTATYSFTNVGGTRSFSCSNHNVFLNMMDGALTGKRDLPDLQDIVMSERWSGMENTDRCPSWLWVAGK